MKEVLHEKQRQAALQSSCSIFEWTESYENSYKAIGRELVSEVELDEGQSKDTRTLGILLASKH